MDQVRDAVDVVPRWLKMLASVALLGTLFYILCLNHNELNHVGIAYDSWTGKIWYQTEPKWYVTHPLVRVGYVSSLPMKVTITSDAKVIVSKVVRLKLEGLDDYLRIQGFTWMNGVSSQENIMLGWAFSGYDVPFMDITQEPGQENLSGLRPIPRN